MLTTFSSKISQRIGLIHRIKFYRPNDVISTLANALVMPHFDYCSPVWTNCNNTLLNSLQIYHYRLAHILLSADVRTHIDDMMNSLNWVNQTKQKMGETFLFMLFKCLTHIPHICLLNSHFTYI